MRKKVITKAEILDVASEIIKEKGVKACSMRALASKSNIAVGTLYNYFPSNKALLEAFFVASWNKTIDRLVGISFEMSPENQLAECYRIIKEDISSRKGLGKELFGLNAFVGDLGDANKKIHEDIASIIVRFIKKTDNNKAISDEQLNISARWLFFSVIDSIILGEDDEKVMDMLIKCFL